MQTWDRYASVRPHRRPANAAGETTWFNWTQFPDHGPGIEILAVHPETKVLDLGCGKGGNLAHAYSIGCRAVGVDISPVQIAYAAERWSGPEFHCADALSFLEASSEVFDAVYSVFGATWFTDPDLMLPAIRRRLRGVFAFSYTRMQEIPGVMRWDLEASEWELKLHEHGFADTAATLIPPPDGMPIGTTLIRCKAD